MSLFVYAVVAIISSGPIIVMAGHTEGRYPGRYPAWLRWSMVVVLAAAWPVYWCATTISALHGLGVQAGKKAAQRHGQGVVTESQADEAIRRILKGTQT